MDIASEAVWQEIPNSNTWHNAAYDNILVEVRTKLPNAPASEQGHLANETYARESIE